MLERADGEPVFAAVQHADAADAAEQFALMLEEVLPQHSQVLVEPMVDVLATHTGKGAIGLSVIFAEPA